MIRVGEYGRRHSNLPMDECYHCQAEAEREFVGYNVACCVFPCGAVHLYPDPDGERHVLMAPCGVWVDENEPEG